ncbi:Crp/Fnr family transcriptional regulator [Alkalispirillum mobile]|uniref:Crp/Fnr family transcriptional regulator n=1 Tax=Alkalispirillum mobile TaxID=85925 RepID=A0A498BZD3_9GAMM|nr:Crp/Fnr family transcriptional regulator [Alkalispirillum mobile]RLK48812.1 Crp/Fnr family transcriptional regulator [Alkalispirillum mobile]
MPLTKSHTYADELSASPLFNGLAPRQISEVLGRAQPHQLEAGETLFNAGETANSFYLLYAGAIKLLRGSPQGQDVVVRILRPFEPCAACSVIGKQAARFPITARAWEGSVVLAWPAQAMREELKRLPTLQTNLLEIVARYQEQTVERLCEASTAQVPQRLAQCLLRLAEQAGTPTADGVRLADSITRQDLAELCGTTLHTVSRTLSGWERDGLVRVGRCRVTLTSLNRLRLLSGS